LTNDKTVIRRTRVRKDGRAKGADRTSKSAWQRFETNATDCGGGKRQDIANRRGGKRDNSEKDEFEKLETT